VIHGLDFPTTQKALFSKNADIRKILFFSATNKNQTQALLDFHVLFSQHLLLFSDEKHSSSNGVLGERR